ncbi:MAG: CoA transferase [Candidatus Binatia bacterium]|nr:MAG: CoA transferase [Candidatus Binatia bacterium]
MERPLEGLRILAFTQLGAGPYAMTLLGDLGAEVVKIEDPAVGGDEARNVPPEAADGDGPYFQALNRNAKSLTLNLRVPEGRDLFHRLVAVSDAVYANTRGDLPEKLGLRYEALRPYNPRIVCCTLSGFGTTGPLRSHPGYDYLVQAMAGFMSLTGEPDGPPAKCGVSVVDFSAGLASALGLLVGLHRARQTGLGCDVDVSLLDTAVSMLNYLAAWVLNTDYRPRRLPDSAHPSLVPSQNFPTRDGWIVVMCMKEKFWERFARLLELDFLLEDARFRTFADRLAHREELLPILKEKTRSRTTAEWLRILGGRVPCAPVLSVEEALASEAVRSSGMIVEYPHPRFGTFRAVGCPIRVAGTAPRYEAAPSLGAHTAEVLRSLLGLGPSEIDELGRKGAI